MSSQSKAISTHLRARTGQVVQVCTRCIYDERVASISFDENGVCNYCKQIDEIAELYGTGTARGEATLEKHIEEIRRAGKGKQYDCIVGVSGGTDSSYMCHLAKREWGLRPLAVHYDNTWNSAIATQNIHKVLSALDIDLYTHVVNNKEMDDLFRSFFRAGVAEIEAPTDLGAAEILYRAAWKSGTRYILEGHSFVTEGITPLGRNYFDGRYIDNVHSLYGELPRETYPLMTFSRMMWWTTVARIKKIRPYWYMSYTKEQAKELLQREYGWEYYGGHHLENRMTAFFHSVYAPGKFNSDFRNNTLSALVRMGKISREEAWEEYNTPPLIEDGLVEYFRKRLELSENEYLSQMNAPPRSWHEYKTYKKRFERLRPLFALLSKASLVPHSFYLKYCFPAKDPRG
ncbi:MAG: N-acetyl sugar amidotransferase [Paracoccaceae bacterium]